MEEKLLVGVLLSMPPVVVCVCPSLLLDWKKGKDENIPCSKSIE
jgi:hypothetical protein